MRSDAPAVAISLRGEEATIDQSLCTECEACADACPERAILILEEPALIPRAEREIAPAIDHRAPVPLAARVAPAVGAALFFLGREIAPRMADYLLEALDRRMMPGSIGGRGETRATPREGKTSGIGRRLRRRHRGR